MNKFLLIRLGILLVALSWATLERAYAQTEEESKNAEALNALYGDFAAPDLTAPTLLGVNANQVSKPANVKAFAANIIGAVASFPEKGTGLGVEIAPAQFLQRCAWKSDTTEPRSLNESLKRYGQWQNQLGRNFTISGAQISTDSTAKAAVGVALVLLDRTDPLLDKNYIQSLAKALSSQQAAQDFGELFRSYNSSIAKDRDRVYKDLAIYDDAWPALRRTAAQPLLLAVEALLKGNAIGLLPPSPGILSPHDDFGVAQDAALVSLETALTAETLLSVSQRNGLLKEAERNVGSVKSAYQTYYNLRQKVAASTAALVKTARENFDKKLWNATQVQFGGGWTWCSPDNTFGTLKPQSRGAFLRAALRPAGRDWENIGGVRQFLYWHTQLVANIQYQRYHNPSNVLRLNCRTTVDSLDNRLWYGARFLVGGAYFRLSIEGSMQNLTYSQLAREAANKAKKQLAGTIYSTTIGAEVRLVEKVWLEFGIGGSKPIGQDTRLLALAGLKYAIRNSQRFKTN